jgi:hypothetical protein
MADWRPRDPGEIAAMTPQQRKQYEHELQIAVFGVGHRVDADGKPIEQGIGSAQNQSAQHKAAIAREKERARLIGTDR